MSTLTMLGQILVHILAESLGIVQQLQSRKIGFVDGIGHLLFTFLFEMDLCVQRFCLEHQRTLLAICFALANAFSPAFVFFLIRF
mgnify:FL=1